MDPKSSPKLKKKAVFRTSPNIALIKYWGKFDETDILPLNSSLSLTLSPSDLFTETSVSMSNSYSQDSFQLNGVLQPNISSRLMKILSYFRLKCKLSNDCFFRIKSKNSFPTASGLASSASGYAAIAVCLADLLSFIEEYPGHLTEIARIGSGSACRSLHGGLVEWQGVPEEYLTRENRDVLVQKDKIVLGEEERKKLNSFCIASQVCEPQAFANLQILVLLAHQNEKEVGSTDGMKLSVKTSDLLWHRVINIVPKRVKEMKEAIKEGKFNELMEITIKDSNQFHAVCMDTTPPLMYLNDFSRNVIAVITQINKVSNVKVGYTFDAGPHAVLLVHADIFEDVFKLVLNITKIEKECLNESATKYLEELKKEELEIYKDPKFKEIEMQYKNSFKPYKIIQTKVGSGPIKMNVSKN